MTAPRGRIFWTGRSQAVRLPREFRLPGHAVSIRRSGKALIIEPVDEWPEGYVASFVGASDLERPAQGSVDERDPL